MSEYFIGGGKYHDSIPEGSPDMPLKEFMTKHITEY
jgi:hypothetical protein